MQSVDKKYFVFNKGINTEAPLVAWPEGFTVDEQNFDLLQDGSRRRRLGVSYEAGGNRSFFSCLTADSGMASGTRFYRWKNVNNNDDHNFIVAQIGASLYFWEDPLSGPLGVYLTEFSLGDYRVHVIDPVLEVEYTATDAQLASMIVTFSEADGKLVVVGEHIEPFFIAYENHEFVGKEIDVIERDMFGIDDGIPVEVSPETLSESHQYNLYSRGWLEENINQVFLDKDKYPAKNMLQYLGLRRQTEKSFTDEDGIKVFSPDKLFSQIFQNMSAPIGHLTRSAFDRRHAWGSQGQSTDLKTIKSVDEVNTGSDYITITVNESPHGVNEGDYVFIKGMALRMRGTGGHYKTVDFTGSYEVSSVIDADTFTFDIPHTQASYRSVVTPGMYTKEGAILVEHEDFYPSTTRFTQTAAFAGRVFYGGCTDSRMTDRVYYSKTIESDKDFGTCFQEADPTSEYISDLIPTDGGFITIPNLGILRAMVPYGRALLLFSSEGVWAIGPGEGGLFSATGYSVTKITSAGCIAGQSVVIADNVPVYWSDSGIFAVMQDSNSGFLSAENMTQTTINGIYHAIRHTEKTRVKAAYDPVRKRVFFLYNSRLMNPATGVAPITGESDEYSTSITPMGIIEDVDETAITFDSALIFDLRLKAWTRWVFGYESIFIRDVFCLSTNYSTDSLNGGLRFLSQENGTTKFYLGELTETTFEDWGVESPAFIYTGPDSLGEPERFKYAPYVHVFMRKESNVPLVVDQDPDPFTGASPGSEVDLVLFGKLTSVFMQPRWDWSRGANSGKIANYVQVYRETKPNPDAFGLVVTKNKVRGRGRNLFLCFKAGVNAPAWLDGWTIKYDAQVKI